MFHQNPVQIFDHTCDDNGIKLINTEEAVDVAYIHYINASNDLSMNYDDNYVHKYYAPFVSSTNHQGVFSGT